MSGVTIGFSPRERFSLAAESLQRIFDCTHIPFNLIVVDCNIPQKYREQMDRVLDGRHNVKFIRTDHYLHPNQSRNLIIQEAKDDFVCLMENDILVEEDWLPYLIAACEEHPADVAVPLILEGREHSAPVHFDVRYDHIRQIQQSDGVKLEIVPRDSPKDLDKRASQRTVEFIECHCMFFRRTVFGRIGPFDEEVNPEYVDMSLALYDAGVPIVFEPQSRVRFLAPPSISPDEREFFYFRWDLQKAIGNNTRIKEKWHVLNLPESIDFVKERHIMGSLHLVMEEIAALIPPREPFILVDDDMWRGSDLFEGYHAIPFLERDGQYWGPPADNEAAIRELERLRQSGACFIVFIWPSLWWLEHYSRFNKYLQSNYRCVLENNHLIVFDLGLTV